MPAMTFVATLEAVTQAGGVPVVADIHESDLNLDPDAAAAAIERTNAVRAARPSLRAARGHGAASRRSGCR